MNFDLAESYYLKAIVNQSLLAHLYLGFLLQRTHRKDSKRALKHYITAAKQGLTEAQIKIASSFMLGDIFRRSDKDALTWMFIAGEPVETHFIFGTTYKIATPKIQASLTIMPKNPDLVSVAHSRAEYCKRRGLDECLPKY